MLVLLSQYVVYLPRQQSTDSNRTYPVRIDSEPDSLQAEKLSFLGPHTEQSSRQ